MQTLLPILLVDNTNDINLTQQFTRELHKTISKFNLDNFTNKYTNIQKAYIPDKLKTFSKVWIRIDRVHKPLEAPCTGFFKFLNRCLNIIIKINDDVQT